MKRKSIAFVSAILLLVLVGGATGATEDLELKVDFGYPIDPCDPGDPCNVVRTERTSKPGWWIWTSMTFWDVFFHHDGVWEDGSQGGEPAGPGIDGTGIHAYIDIGYAGDTGMHIFGMLSMGDGMEPNGLPDPDTGPICNSEILSPRHRGAGYKGDDGSVYLTFTRLMRGRYELLSYHNDLVYLDPYTPEGDEPLEPRVIHSILVTGEGVTQIQGANDVEIQAETSDDNLVPSVVIFETAGIGPAQVEYVTPPMGIQHWGGAAVLNAFILRGWAHGGAFWPNPPNGATDVHPDVQLSWSPGAYADTYNVFLGTEHDDVNDADTTSPEYVGNFVYDHNYYQPPEPLILGQTYYWRVDEVNDVCSPYVWKVSTWSFTVDDGKAHGPSPGSLATDVAVDANLSWSAGDYAAWHEVYFGTDAEAVRDATDPNTPPGRGRQDRQDPCSYNPGALEFGQTYYWRIDEINPGYVNSKGDVWAFTTTQYTVVVDDMESYNTTDNRIMDTWLDGWVNDTGAEVYLGIGTGDNPDPVYDGNQSMLYMYDNNDPWEAGVDYYSEIEVDTSMLPIGSDWTVPGLTALTLFFYGNPDNDANEQMYLILKDTEGDYRQVDYGCYGEDMNDIKKEEWQEWNIALQDFTAANVNLTAVKKVYIGFGIRGNPNPGGTPGGSGVVYFDDIRLCPPRCLTRLGQPEGDLNDDCVVDYKDLIIMAGDWLQRDIVDVTAPNRDGLLVEYTFDTDYSDTSGNERHGIPAMNASVSDGNLVLNALYESYVDIPLGAANPFDGLTDCTLQMTFSSNGGRQILLTSSAMFSKQDEHPMIFHTQKDEEESNWCPTLHFWHDGGGRDGCIVNFNDGMMHTVVFTYDADTFALRYYSDGYEDGMYEVRHWMPVAYPGFPQHVVRIGDSASYSMARDMETSNFIGEIDSVRIYDYMLSELEVMYVSTDGTGIRQIPSQANLYNEEPPGSRAVNFRDYAKLADAWLEKSYWP